jgi:hypothetical protein
MRDWLWPITPVAAAGYFLVFPQQFYALIAWAEHYVH